MNILFASGDVGGARALVPVMQACREAGWAFSYLKHGFIVTEAAADWTTVSCDQTTDEEAVKALLREERFSAMIFVTSVKDATALRLARWVQAAGLPVLFVLDNWTNYRHQMELDGQPTFRPTRYLVMDELAREEAVRDGIDPTTITIVGQPALASLGHQAQNHWQASTAADDIVRLVFVSEPVSADQGASAVSPRFRGYTEASVLKLFCDGLQPYAERVQVDLLPHPREDVDRLLTHWTQYAGRLEGTLRQLAQGRDALWAADGVAGMASILLYEAWLIGKPVISLQPGLRRDTLRMLAARPGVIFVDSVSDVGPAIDQWVTSMASAERREHRPELRLHEQAPVNVLAAALACMEEKAA